MRALLNLALLLLLLLSGILFGWRANITLEPEPIKYVPVPVRNTLSYHHWYLPRWPENRP